MGLLADNGTEYLQLLLKLILIVKIRLNFPKTGFNFLELVLSRENGLLVHKMSLSIHKLITIDVEAPSTLGAQM